MAQAILTWLLVGLVVLLALVGVVTAFAWLQRDVDWRARKRGAKARAQVDSLVREGADVVSLWCQSECGTVEFREEALAKVREMAEQDDVVIAKLEGVLIQESLDRYPAWHAANVLWILADTSKGKSRQRALESLLGALRRPHAEHLVVGAILQPTWSGEVNLKRFIAAAEAIDNLLPEEMIAKFRSTLEQQKEREREERTRLDAVRRQERIADEARTQEQMDQFPVCSVCGGNGQYTVDLACGNCDGTGRTGYLEWRQRQP